MYIKGLTNSNASLEYSKKSAVDNFTESATSFRTILKNSVLEKTMSSNKSEKEDKYCSVCGSMIKEDGSCPICIVPTFISG